MQATEQGEAIAAAAPRKAFDKNYFSYVPPAFITLILLVGQITYGILDNYLNVVAAIVTSLISEVVLARTVLGIKKNLASAYVTGISVGILVRSNVLWPYIFTALISIMSKYVLRYKGRHLWNPSNFGVSWMLLVATPFVAGLSIQWGSNFAAMGIIWTLGLGLVYRAKKIHVTLTYVACFIILAYVRSLINGDTFLAEVSPLTGPMYQLFIFFMVTDPGVAVSTKRGQVIVVAIVALVEFGLRLAGVIYAPFYALCLVGPVARYIDLSVNTQKQTEKPAIAP
jgi:Na+-translocating ferredoxin:NAD+ oxidoreductase RnfD subunit